LKKYDITILTDSRYVNPGKINAYVQDILDEDKLVIQALAARGLSVNRVDWADPDYDWSATKIALFRTTWDYFDRIDEFIKWIDLIKDKVNFINPIELILWNLDKHYLQDLSEKDINIPDTKFVEPGEQTTLSNVFHDTGWKDAILKPAVSGSARHTYRLSENNVEDHETIFQELIAKESMLLQSFQNSVLKRGEVALMYFDGNFSHAVQKIAKPGDFRVQSEFGGTVQNYTPTTEELTLGEKSLQACAQVPAYARVDIIDDNDGNPAVSELELIEPELWFRFYPSAGQAMADAIIKHINTLTWPI
jgi:glutathione synthase/RimK-type ligase-like ATP-grasp enzyme